MREYTAKEEEKELLSDADILKGFAQTSADSCRYLHMALSRGKKMEKEKLRLEDEISALQRRYDSVQIDRDLQTSQLQSQILQLQGEVDRYRSEKENWLNGRKEQERLMNENADLKSRLHKLASDATHGL